MDESEGDATGNVTVTRIGLREGGWIGYGDDAIFIQRDDERIKISTRTSRSSRSEFSSGTWRS
jgi:hypothetical protein